MTLKRSLITTSRTAVVVGLTILILVPSKAESQGLVPRICSSREGILALLESNKEEKIGVGMSSTGRVVELYLSKTGSFSVAVNDPLGQTCLVGYGEGWIMKLPSWLFKRTRSM